jgi:hypothetical protein
MTTPLSLPFAAARLSAVAANLANALANEETDPLAPLAHLDRAFDLMEILSWGMCREPASFPVAGLREIARDLINGHDPAPARVCGGPRGGMPTAQFADQVAGVVLSAAVLAETTGVDLEAAISRKAAALRSQAAAATAPGGSGE